MLFRKKRLSRKPDMKSVHKLPVEAQRQFWVEEFKKTDKARVLKEAYAEAMTEIAFRRSNRKSYHDMEVEVIGVTLNYINSLAEFAKGHGASAEVMRKLER